MQTAMVVAVSENGMIGHQGKVPWHLPAELKYFKERTLGEKGSRNALIMGRNTWESIPPHSRPLSGRANIVVSSTLDQKTPGHRAISIVPSLSVGLKTAERFACTTAFVIGGVRLYREAMMLVDTIYLTVVHTTVEGDIALPELLTLPKDRWKLTENELHEADEANPFAFTVRVYRVMRR